MCSVTVAILLDEAKKQKKQKEILKRIEDSAKDAKVTDSTINHIDDQQRRKTFGDLKTNRKNSVSICWLEFF